MNRPAIPTSLPPLASLLTALLLALPAPAAAQYGEPEPDPGGDRQCGAGDVEVEARNDLTFRPAQVTIPVGGVVCFTNGGGAHNVNFGSFACADTCESPGNQPSPNAWVARVRFDEAGRHDYQCDAHVSFGMTGTVTVEGDGGDGGDDGGDGGGDQEPPPQGDALLLLGERFRVTAGWRNQFDGSFGPATPIPSTDLAGYYYFTDPRNIELMVKVLDFGDRILLFYGQLTNLRFELKVQDTRSGEVKTFANGVNDCGAIVDNVFPSGSSASAPRPLGVAWIGPGLATDRPLTLRRRQIDKGLRRQQKLAGACAPGDGRLCLLEGRIAVELDWRNQFSGAAGAGRVEALSQLTGQWSFDDPRNVEVLTKALDFGDRILFLWGSLSNLEYHLRVTDTASGETNTYDNPPGTFCGGLDDDAF